MAVPGAFLRSAFPSAPSIPMAESSSSAHSHDEFGLISWIRDHVARQSPLPAVTLGIGDDSAAVRLASSLSPDSECLVAVDMLLEGVHFETATATPQQIGRKALAVNLSDIAAMAGTPIAAVVSVSLPRRLSPEFARDLHAGLADLAAQFDVALVGGDTNVWDGPLVISVTVLGRPPEGGSVLRSGAQVGDAILVTGQLGGSLSGHHLDFTPRVQEARLISEAVALHSMIDISDGLAADLHHILEESGVGAILHAPAVPISAAAIQAAGAAGQSGTRSALDRALSDGEDFELLFTLSTEAATRLLSHPPCKTPITRIGEIIAEPGCTLRDATGKSTPLAPSGWRHR